MVKGFAAWVMHRGYHGLAIPSWERKLRVMTGWALAVVLGRDTSGLHNLQDPRAAFVDATPSAVHRDAGGPPARTPEQPGVGPQVWDERCCDPDGTRTRGLRRDRAAR